MITKKNNNLLISYLTLRQLIGVLGILLPFISMLFGCWLGDFSVRGSISAYYYTNVRDIFVGLLVVVSFFLITYKGYGTLDNVVTSISGFAGFAIAIFPCSVDGISHAVGLFQFPIKTSNIIHLSSATLFFLLLAVNSFFLFTKSDPAKIKTRQKKIRNAIYRVSGIVIFLSLVAIALFIWLTSSAYIEENKIILFFEIIMLVAFGISWLVKGEAIFKDKKK